MQLKDVTPIIKAILEERDKIPRIIDKERYIPNPQPYHDGDCMRGGIRKALRIIEQAPVVDAIPRWISVEERLPKDSVKVLVYDALNQQVRIMYAHDDGSWWDERDRFYCNVEDGEITHWTSLPEPPKEEERS